MSAPRAGSTLLFETLAQAAGIHTIDGESHRLIESIDALRPGGGAVTSNRLTAKDATPAIVAELRRRFAAQLRDRDGNPPAPGAAARLLEFAGLSMDSRLAEYLSKPLPLSPHTKTTPDPDKWRQDAVEIDRVLPAGRRVKIGLKS